MDIKHEVSSSYNPSSNGLAESAVKQAKYLMVKCLRDKQDYSAALHEFRNTPRADGFSPYQLMFGHRAKTALPALEAAMRDVSKMEGHAARKRHADAWAAASDSRRVRVDFSVGDRVLVHDPISKGWLERATIISKEPGGSYNVVGDRSDRVKYRNSKNLRLIKQKNTSPVSANE